jgi:hypothetical protein
MELELRTNKAGKSRWTKPPRRADNPDRAAESDEPNTWSTYGVALAAVEAKKADGIGYMLAGSNIGAIDLDHCRDPESGAVDGWAEPLQSAAHSRLASFVQEPRAVGGSMFSGTLASSSPSAGHRTLAPTLQRGAPAFEPWLSHAERIRVSASKRSGP